MVHAVVCLGSRNYREKEKQLNQCLPLFSVLQLKEVKIFAALIHPNIVRYHSCWIEDETGAVKGRFKCAKVAE